MCTKCDMAGDILQRAMLDDSYEMALNFNKFCLQAQIVYVNEDDTVNQYTTTVIKEMSLLFITLFQKCEPIILVTMVHAANEVLPLKWRRVIAGDLVQCIEQSYSLGRYYQARLEQAACYMLNLDEEDSE
jgi:hypothetical protein